MIAQRYVARGYVFAMCAALAALTILFLIIDFADRAKIYTGAGWLLAVVELYACKAAVTAYQLAPAGLALGAAIAMSGLRRTGEVTALRALGRTPATFAVPVAIVSGVTAGALFLLEDPVVVRANYRAEEITVQRFHRWGDWVTYHHDRRWFRGKGERMYYLGRIDDAGFADVTVYELTKEFRLARRIDASRMEPTADGAWLLRHAVTRTFAGDTPMTEVREDERIERFPDDVREFRVKKGRPSQIRRREIPEQIAARRRVGLPTREWELALHERRAYQLAGIPAALLGMGLALRPRRRGHLTAAIAEGFVVTIALWGANAVCRTLTLAGHFDPIVGGWLPSVLVCVAAAIAVRFAR